MGLYKDLSEYLILIGPRVGIKGTPPPVWPDSNAIMLHCPKKSCILLLIIVWWWRCLIEATSIQNLWTKKNNKKKNMGNPVELCEPRSEVEWVGVNQGENLCLCMCVHTCICLEKEWRMWCNICEMFFQTSSTSQRRLSLIFNLNPPPHPPPCSDSSSDDTQWNVCTVVPFSLPENEECLNSIYGAFLSSTWFRWFYCWLN